MVKKFGIGLLGLAMIWLGTDVISAATPPDFYVPWTFVAALWFFGIGLAIHGFRSIVSEVLDQEPSPGNGPALPRAGTTRPTPQAQISNVTAGQVLNPYTGETVYRRSADADRWNISVNRSVGDTQKVQVFIVNMRSDEDYLDYMPEDQVVSYIQKKTGLSKKDIERFI